MRPEKAKKVVDAADAYMLLKHLSGDGPLKLNDVQKNAVELGLGDLMKQRKRDSMVEWKERLGI